MKRSVKYLASAAILTCTLSFSQIAQAAFLFYGTKSIDLSNSSNDCLTVGIGTLNRLAFSNLNRSDNGVSGVRQNVLLVITCVGTPAPRFVMVVMAVGDDGPTTKSVTDLVLSNF